MGVPQQQFLMRRLHSLTGMAPMGVFLFEHFFTNSYSHQGETVYNGKVHFLTSLPYLPFIEIGLLLLPFAFHIIYGLKIMYSGEYIVRDNHNPRGVLYVLQRVSAIPALIFIVYHVWTTRLGDHGADPNFFRVMTEKFSNPWIVAFYWAGIISICFHFANGIATFCMTWGITISPMSQKIVGAAAAGVGVILAAMAINSIYGFNESGFDESAEAATELSQAINVGYEYLKAAFRG